MELVSQEYKLEEDTWMELVSQKTDLKRYLYGVSVTEDRVDHRNTDLKVYLDGVGVTGRQT